NRVPANKNSQAMDRQDLRRQRSRSVRRWPFRLVLRGDRQTVRRNCFAAIWNRERQIAVCVHCGLRREVPHAPTAVRGGAHIGVSSRLNEEGFWVFASLRKLGYR